MKIFIGAVSGQVYVEDVDGRFMEYDDYVGGSGFIGDIDAWGEEIIALEDHPMVENAVDIVNRYIGHEVSTVIWATTSMVDYALYGRRSGILFIEIENTIRRLVNEKKLG